MYFQWVLVAVAITCVALGRAYGGDWLLASLPFALGSLGPGFVHFTYTKEWRRANVAFDARETPAALKPYLGAVEEAERRSRKSRWWRRSR
ncbi:hypothetical protein EEB14_57960 [Rhodococcus sp. WS4]|nr:hypothetical protein EEB14_57960 [Rhodococcus sp. WS4]